MTSLTNFLIQHSIKKDEKGDAKPVTNTRIGDKTANIYGGSYHIPEEEYETFLKLYYKECIKGNKKEYLTEAQLKENGPILVDVDFRYDYSVTERIHTREHITDLITLYLEELKKVYVMDEDIKIPFFVFEKDNVNRLEEKKLTKDGIHIIIGVQCINHDLQQIIRAAVVGKIANVWTDIPIVNTWEEVFDEGISKGHTNFQLYGSMKPNNEAYKLVTVYIGGYEENGEIKFYDSQPPTAFQNEQHIYKLSVRYPNHTTLMLKDEITVKLEGIKSMNEKKNGSGIGGGIGGGGGATGAGGGAGMTYGVIRNYEPDTETAAVKIEEILAIRSSEELASCVLRFLDSLDLIEYNLRDAYEYTMSLPKSYYGESSFDKWIRVGWALRNISSRLFIVWLAFSSQKTNFSFMTEVSELYEKWKSFEKKDTNTLTIRSIMYWSKNENPDGYKKITNNSIDAYINKTLENALITTGEDDSKIMGFTDYDLASVLYHLYKEDYVCVSIKANIWYRFNGNLWTEIDSGTTLRSSISTHLRYLYKSKLGQLGRYKLTLAEGDPIRKRIDRKVQIIGSISEKLGKTNDKNNIMREAKELFYDSDFLHKIDSNEYIICFKNCVVDFKEKTARIGKPEDYLTKSTGIVYKELNPDVDKPIIDEINDFMHKLFPNKELYDYMWQHLASTLIGTTSNQTFNMYIGVGQNGKSVLVNLMEQVLGQYKGDVPLTLITQQRTKIGGVSPEIVQLKGIRYAVMQEPSKGDRINEGIMKQLSAGDPLTGRAPYMVEAQTFTPQFKLVVCSNEFMEIKSQDHGTWRRIRVVDFESLFTETPKKDDPEKPYQFKLDKNIKEKFCRWKEVFAAMLVEIAYKTQGDVEDCEKVLSSSRSYRKGQDVLSEYTFERVQSYPTGCITKGQLVSDFKEWFTLNYGNGKANNAKDLVSAMDKQFGKNLGGIWKGVRFTPIIVVNNESEFQAGNNDPEDECEFDLQEL